ncbi:hypothetical protein ACWEPC_15995 [Nonomuraea sp. NPDC004297]
MEDFGIAELTSETATRLTATGVRIDTPSSMSPGQADGKPADHPVTREATRAAGRERVRCDGGPHSRAVALTLLVARMIAVTNELMLLAWRQAHDLREPPLEDTYASTAQDPDPEAARWPGSACLPPSVLSTAPTPTSNPATSSNLHANSATGTRRGPYLLFGAGPFACAGISIASTLAADLIAAVTDGAHLVALVRLVEQALSVLSPVSFPQDHSQRTHNVRLMSQPNVSPAVSSRRASDEA